MKIDSQESILLPIKNGLLHYSIHSIKYIVFQYMHTVFQYMCAKYSIKTVCKVYCNTVYFIFAISILYTGVQNTVYLQYTFILTVYFRTEIQYTYSIQIFYRDLVNTGIEIDSFGMVLVLSKLIPYWTDQNFNYCYSCNSHYIFFDYLITATAMTPITYSLII